VQKVAEAGGFELWRRRGAGVALAVARRAQ